MTNAIAIRKKVAELCGYKRLNVYANAGDNPHIGADVPILRGFKKNSWHIIPPYELSIDAIAQAFDDHGLSYTLKKAVIENENAGCFASNPEGGEHFSDNAAKALCYLFIHCMEKQLKFFNPAQNQ